jgi:uncharacterized protein (TIGR02302 family)
MKRTSFRPQDPSPEPPEDGALARRFERRVRLSLVALFFERVWEAMLWPFIVVSLFLIVSLLGAWSLFPPLLHRILLGAFGIAFVLSFLPLVRISLPTRAEALRRLEKTAKFDHRPASSYEDRLGATPPRETALLWAAHRERLARLIAKLKPTWPAPRTDRKDPYAIRSALLVALVAATFAAGADAWVRLASAFSPAASAAPSLVRLDAWVTPPIYTGAAPIVLADGNEAVGSGAEFRALSVPERSNLIVRAHAPQGEAVTLSMGNPDGSAPNEVEPRKGGSNGLVEFNLPLKSPATADVKIDGETVAKWHFDLIKDEAPTIGLVGEPTATPRGALRLLFRASDDHGVASAEAHFALAEGEEAKFASPSDLESVPSGVEKKTESDPLLNPPTMPLQLPHANAKQVEGRATQDLTAHPWAGLKVHMTLVAQDQADQKGESGVYEFVLPERNFTKPLARAVVEQRKKLVRDPGSAFEVARALDALTIGDEKVIDDSDVYLGLRDAYWRLENDQSRESLGSVVDQLWSVALRIEEGDLPEAERDLQAAQDALQQALKENASPDEIKRLVDELRAALSRYLQTLASQNQDKNNLPQQQQPNGDQLLSQQDLDKMLKNIEDLAQAGSKDLAEQMLAELKDVLERLQTSNMGENQKQQQQAERMMKDLGQMISEQQKLLDDTFKEKQRQGNGQGQSDQFEVSPPARRIATRGAEGSGKFAATRGAARAEPDAAERAAGSEPRPEQSAWRAAAGLARQIAKPDRPPARRRREAARADGQGA